MPQAWRPLSGARPVLARAWWSSRGRGLREFAPVRSPATLAPAWAQGVGRCREAEDTRRQTPLVFDPRGKIVAPEGKTLTIKTAGESDINVPVTGDLKDACC